LISAHLPYVLIHYSSNQSVLNNILSITL